MTSISPSNELEKRIARPRTRNPLHKPFMPPLNSFIARCEICCRINHLRGRPTRKNRVSMTEMWTKVKELMQTTGPSIARFRDFY